jgi:hypothetical protein
MFQWNQTYLINSAKDALSGLDKVVDNGDVFKVRRVAEFVKENIVAVSKAEYKAAKAGSATIDIKKALNGATDSDLFRIKLYVRLSGSNNSYYANDFVFKGKPFVYEIKGNASAESAYKLINSINTLYDDKFLKVTHEEGSDVITFTGDNYTMFTDVAVEKYGAENYSLSGGSWDAVYDLESPKDVISVVSCVNGFGTFEQVLKDLRLPTLDNTNWTSANMEEMPVPGAEYNQYTVVYRKEVGVQGAAHIGDVVVAETVHSFYVNKNLTDVIALFDTLAENPKNAEGSEE